MDLWPNQSTLSAEDYIHPSQWDYEFATTYVDDVMAYIRRIITKSLTPFGELCETLWKIIYIMY